MPTIVQISDTHLFDDPDGVMFGVNTRRSLARVLEQALRQDGPIDVVLATGDLAHDGSPAAYSRLKTVLDRFNTPVLCLPGNHDDPVLMRQILNGPRVTCDRTIASGAWTIILLTTHVAGSDGGRLAPSELDFLEHELASTTDTSVVIALHHPPVAIGSPWMDAIGLADAAALLDVVGRYPQVRVMLFGHIHQEFDRTLRGVRMLGVPSTCAQFRPRTETHIDDPAPPGYRWLRLFDDGRFETGVARVEPAGRFDV